MPEAAASLQSLLSGALALHQQGHLDEAESAYFDALQLSPEQPDALHLLGLISKAKGNLEVAEKLIRRSLSVRPDFASAHYNLGNLLSQKGQTQAALACYQRACALQPDYADAHYACGNCWRDLDNPAAALRAFDRAIAAKPDYMQAQHNRANVLRELGRVQESVAALQAVVARVPDLAEAHYNLALSLFTLGRYCEGGPHYDWRWRTSGFTSPARNFAQPLWQGQDLPGKTLLIYAEQGLGDTLQFIRYAALVRPKVGRLVIEVQPALIALLTPALAGIAELVGQGQPLPPFAMHVPMLSLPALLGTDLPDVPARIPYLQAEPDRLAHWRAQIGAHGFKVGLNWQGNPKAAIDKGRSIPLQLLAPLGDIPNIRLIALQKNEGLEQVALWPGRAPIALLGEGYDSHGGAFLDAAAVLQSLDVFVTTDTALCHLAGALGVPTFLLLKHVPDWRWGLSDSKTPWYPAHTVIRQPARGAWQPVISALVNALEQCQSASESTVAKDCENAGSYAGLLGRTA